MAVDNSSGRTPLDLWLFNQRRSIRAAAAAWGISHEALRLIVLGRRRASEEIAARIVADTKGAVTLADLGLSEQPPRADGEAQQDGWAG